MLFHALDFKLYGNKESTHTFSVPDNLRQITFTVWQTAKSPFLSRSAFEQITVEVRVNSTGSTQTLTQSKQFALNSIDGQLLPLRVLLTHSLLCLISCNNRFQSYR